jgi:tetratricopeptide (TPR) repeat protein
MPKKSVIQIAFSYFFILGISYSSSSIDTLTVVRDYIKHADTYYWFGMAESGNVESFNKGHNYLDRAKVLLAGSKINDDTKIEVMDEINALTTDLNGQIALSYDTFYGVFPVVRLITTSIFKDPFATGTYELVDDPMVIASTAAMKNMAIDIVGKWGREPQLDIVFTSVPNNSDLENEALYIFNTSTKYFVHNKREVVSVFDKKELDNFEQAVMTPEMKDKLISNYNSSTLVMAVVRELDIVDDDYFYLAEAYAYNKSTDAPIRSLYVMGFSRDRTSNFHYLILVNIILLILAVVLYNYFHSTNFGDTKSKNYKLTFDKVYSTGSAAVFYFLSGKLIPLLIIPLVSFFKPMPETLAKTSFWWPLVLGIFMFSGPAILLKVTSVRLGKFSEFFMARGRGAASAIAISVGVAAYFSGILVILPADNLLISILCLFISATAGAFIFGLSLDEREDSLSPKYVFVSLIAFALLGFALCSGDYTYLLLSAAISVATLLIVLYINNLLPGKKGDEEQKSSEDSREIESDLSGLTRLIIEHDYVPFEYYDKDIKPVIDLLKSKSIALVLAGESGVGKTATADELIRESIRNWICSDKDCKEKIEDKRGGPSLEDKCPKCKSKMNAGTLILKGQCQTPVNTEDDSSNLEDQEALFPFKEALAGHFKINLLAPDNAKYQQIESAMSGIYNTVMPIAGVFLPPMTPEENRASSDREIKLAVSSMFKTLLKAEKKDVVLFIDDYQWIDEQSKELLNFLLEEFIENGKQSEEENHIAFILTKRISDPESKKTDIIDNKLTPFVIKKPKLDQSRKILTESLNIEEKSADRILNRTGDLSKSDTRGQLFWLFQLVVHIAQNDLFEPDSSGRFRIKKWVGEIPVPNDMKESIRTQFENQPEYKPVLECAACLGMEFQASVLSESLNTDRMELLRILKEIEAQTGMIKDVKEADDLFKFQSSLILEVVREQMSISGKGPKAEDVPQIVREYHAQVATALERDPGLAKGRRFDIANHYFAAGAKYADKAYMHCRKAAHASSSMYDFSKAEKYLDKAEECSIFIDTDANELIEDRIFINCHEAHITAKNQPIAAKKGWDYVEKLTKDDYKEKLGLLIKVTEACYNAMWYVKTEKLADKVIQYSDVNSIETAEGMHFKGLAIDPKKLRDRLSMLKQSYDIVSQLPDSVKKNRLLGRIMNSYGSEMTKPDNSDEDKKGGLELLELRLAFDKNHNINDRKGQAITNGAIGRYYHSNTNDIESAEKYFEKDLDICNEIDDFGGASTMYSSLAECSLRKGDFKKAVGRYKESYTYAEKMKKGNLDKRLFSHVGLLTAYSFMKEKDHIQKEVKEWGSRFVKIISEIPKKDTPKFTSAPVTSVDCRAKYKYEMQAEVVDKTDKLTFTAQTLPGWLTFDGKSIISGTPQNDDFGDYSVVLKVTDNSGATAEQSFSISVANTNDVPINNRYFRKLVSQKIKFVPFYDQSYTGEDILDRWKKHFQGDWITGLGKLVKPEQ